MKIISLFGKKYIWLMDHEGKLHLYCLTKPGSGHHTTYVFDETLTRCDLFPPDVDWGLSKKKYLSGGVYEVAYALCEKYLQTNGDR